MKRFIVFVLFLVFSTPVFSGIKDSVGIEKKDGKLFVLHKIDAKETLYSIAKKYACKVEDIKKSNPEMGEAIQVGQMIKIPVKNSVSSDNSTNTSDGNVATHTVQKGESLYGIAKKYNIKVELLQTLNPDTKSGLKEGQVLKLKNGDVVNNSTKTNEVVKPKTETQEENDDPTLQLVNKDQKKKGKTHKVSKGETLYSISKKYDVAIDEIKSENPELINGLSEGMELIIPKVKKSETKTETKTEPTVNEKKTEIKSVKTDVKTPDNNYQQNKNDFDKIVEKGMAEVMTVTSDSPKFQALHKTAPVGTIIQVTNEANSKKIFVRVIGKLEGASSETIIKLSPKALERIEAGASKIAVSLMYIP